jgi:hypothetical protein
MKHLSLFESFRPQYSYWPRKKSYRGVNAIRILQFSNPADLQKIKDHIREAQQKNNWYSEAFDEKGELTTAITNSPDLFFVEIISPRGRREVVGFEDFDTSNSDYNVDGYIQGESMDGRYLYWISATADEGGQIVPDISTLDFERAKGAPQ